MESVHYKNFAALLLFKTILKQLNFKWTYGTKKKMIIRINRRSY